MDLVLAILLLAGQPDKPYLAVRAYPPLSVAALGTGCSLVRLTAEIRGPEAEAWYCPKVEWAWPNGTTSSTESDCVPYAARDRAGWHRVGSEIVDDPAPGFPRRWTREVCLPAGPDPDEPWEIEVRLSRAGRIFAREIVRVHVK